MAYKKFYVEDSKKSMFQAREGLEGPFFYESGVVFYYDPKEGKYYDPTTDFYVENEYFQAVTN